MTKKMITKLITRIIIWKYLLKVKNVHLMANISLNIIYLKEKHEINMCNELLIMKIEIKLEIKMAITNGNVQIKFNQMKIYYNGKNQKLKLKPNLKCTIIIVSLEKEE